MLRYFLTDDNHNSYSKLLKPKLIILLNSFYRHIYKKIRKKKQKQNNGEKSAGRSKRGARKTELRAKTKFKNPKLKNIKIFVGLSRFSKKDKKNIEGLSPIDMDIPDDCFDSMKDKKTSGK